MTAIILIILYVKSDYTNFFIYKVINKIPFNYRHKIKRYFCQLNINIKRNSFSSNPIPTNLILNNSMSLNEYLINPVNHKYLNKFKINIYQNQLKSLRKEIVLYLKYTNCRISIEHLILLDEIKQNLKKYNFIFTSNVKNINILTDVQLQDIRNYQIEQINNPKSYIKKTYLSELSLLNNVSYITEEIKKRIKNEYLEKHNLINDELIKFEYLNNLN
jgi:uncharacterized protein with ATP-grasp and redox domains